MEAFKDYFARRASSCARYQPRYPRVLFELVIAPLERRDLAWDCATSAGQTAMGLAPFFRKVVSSDHNRARLNNAIALPHVEYRLASAERSGLANGSVDLIACAQMLHAVDFERTRTDSDEFYEEVRRIAAPNAWIAAWTYALPSVAPPVDAVVDYFSSHVVGRYCRHTHRNHAPDRNSSLPFPFNEIPTPTLVAEDYWTLQDELGFLRSWPEVQRYMREHEEDPVSLIAGELAQRWGPQARRVTWRFTLKRAPVA